MCGRRATCGSAAMADPSLVYHDVAGLMLGAHEDPREALAASYEFVSRLAVALLQKLGPQRLPVDWLERTEGFVLVAEPLRDGSHRYEAVRRGEVSVARSREEIGRQLEELWDRYYVRRREGM